MKLETQSECLERARRALERVGKQIPGRTLPLGCQWTGRDQPGCGASQTAASPPDRDGDN